MITKILLLSAISCEKRFEKSSLIGSWPIKKYRVNYSVDIKDNISIENARYYE